MLKAIIFDLDGTIVNSLPYHHESWSIFFQRNNLKESDFSEILKKYKGGGTLKLMSDVFGDSYSKKELKEMSDYKEAIFREIYKGNLVSSGVYIYRLEAVGQVQSNKLILLK